MAQLTAFSARLKTCGSSDPKSAWSQPAASNEEGPAAVTARDLLARLRSRAWLGAPVSAITTATTNAERTNRTGVCSWLFSTQETFSCYWTGRDVIRATRSSVYRAEGARERSTKGLSGYYLCSGALLCQPGLLRVVPVHIRQEEHVAIFADP